MLLAPVRLPGRHPVCCPARCHVDSVSPSAALALAQATLLARRQTFQAERLTVAGSLPDIETDHLTTIRPLPCLPPHLGWRASQALRRHSAETPPTPSPVLNPPPPIPPANLQPSTSQPASTLTIQPDLALALLHRRQSATGRLWLLLRHLDTTGCGWVRIEAAKAQLATADAPWRVCSWRQFRHLLQQGRGLFWQLDRGRIWLRSAAHVAHDLGLQRLSSQPVAVPVTHLLAGIGAVRAHLYASFHSGRRAQPIARATLTYLSGASHSTQRNYEARCGIRVQPAYALGGVDSQAHRQITAWQHGRAAFTFIDTTGRHGPRQAAYVAWRLPNTYQGIYPSLSKQSRKRLNRRLIDLAHNGTPGNNRRRWPTRFFKQRATARVSESATIYWRSLQPHLWYTRYVDEQQANHSVPAIG